MPVTSATNAREPRCELLLYHYSTVHNTPVLSPLNVHLRVSFPRNVESHSLALTSLQSARIYPIASSCLPAAHRDNGVRLHAWMR